MDEAQIENLLDATLFQYGKSRIDKAVKDNRRFVHYTSTEAALSIISRNEIWLRNSGVMNDYSEIAHGEACFRFCLFDNEDAVQHAEKVLGQIQEGLLHRLQQHFVGTALPRRAHTYLLSISEHGPETLYPGLVDEESYYGRLSMWRAYGSGGGVALIFDQGPLMNPTNAIPAYTSPVFYGTPSEFAHEFHKVLSSLEHRMDEVKQVDPEIIWTNLANFVHFTCLACKHPGFREEREWRVTYSADVSDEYVSDKIFNDTSRIKREFRVVNSIPQRIYKIPFVSYEEDGFKGMALPEILKSVIIGPTQYPSVVYDTLYFALRKAGFDEEKIKMAVSNIPLRT